MRLLKHRRTLIVEQPTQDELLILGGTKGDKAVTEPKLPEPILISEKQRRQMEKADLAEQEYQARKHRRFYKPYRDPDD
jgi:hypothetical protein